MNWNCSNFRKTIKLKDGSEAVLRPLDHQDEKNFHQLFLNLPERERMFIEPRMPDVKVTREWCRKLDYGRNLPLVGVMNGHIVGVATLHQRLGGWKRHIGRVSVMVEPGYRGRGLASCLINEILSIARRAGLEKAEAEFIGEQTAAMRMFALLGFRELLHLDEYVRDMQAIPHDYILMGLDLKTDEEYAGVGG